MNSWMMPENLLEASRDVYAGRFYFFSKVLLVRSQIPVQPSFIEDDEVTQKIQIFS